MPSTKPPSGMRDYLPETVAKRRYVVAKIESIFQHYGFLPLETPAIENLTTLLGKYGEEGDQLLFRLLHRGDKLSRALEKESTEAGDLAELGLRYDLTVPLARVVAQYGNSLPRFFKRYQIQPVWRADRPAKGRFREFYQCDVDLTGTTSLLAEAEVMNAVSDALLDLGFTNFTIALNHRVLLRSMIEAAAIDPNLEGSAIIAIDKLDKIGVDGVQEELIQRGIVQESAQRLLGMTMSTTQADNGSILESLRGQLSQPRAQQALDDLETLLSLTSDAPAGSKIRLAPALARGLSYYTGPIFEVVSTDFSGSLGGGGRYDDLVKRFTGQAVPATGVSIGVDRLLAALRAKGRTSGETQGPVIVTVMDRNRMADYQAMAGELRQAGIRAEVYLGNPKNFGNQLKYADKRASPVAVIQGEDEAARGVVQIKDLVLGAKIAENASLEEWKSQPAQREIPRADLVTEIRAMLDREEG